MQSGIGRELDRQTARAELEAARVADRHARRAIEMLGPSRPGRVTVVAPIDGTVLRRPTTIGAQVEPGGAPLLEIGDKTALWVVAEVDPGVFEARRVTVGPTAGDHAQVVSGLNPGERVAVAGALLIDQQSGVAL